MKKIKVVQIGVGHDHALAILNTMVLMKDVYEVSAVVVSDEERDKFSDNVKQIPSCVKVVASFDEVEKENLDAIVVETEEERLTETALKFIKLGYPVHMDKPGSENEKDFYRLMDEAEGRNLPVHLGYMYRYNPAIKEIKKQIRRGDIGRIYSIEAQMSCLHTDKKREWLASFQGGMTFFLGCHLVDIIYSVLGKPEVVFPFNTETLVGGVKSKDLGFVVLKYKNGVSFIKSAAAEAGGFTRRQIVFCGERGTVEVKPIERHENDGLFGTYYREVFNEDNNREGWKTVGRSYSVKYDRYKDMMRDFAASVEGGMSEEFSYKYEKELFGLLKECCGEQKEE